MLALFLSYPVLRTSYELPELRLVLQTTMALAGLLAPAGRGRGVADPRPAERRAAALLSHRLARPASARHAHRRGRLGRAFRPARRRPGALARARFHAHALRRAAPRVPAAPREL